MTQAPVGPSRPIASSGHASAHGDNAPSAARRALHCRQTWGLNGPLSLSASMRIRATAGQIAPSCLNEQYVVQMRQPQHASL
jgi:hypothetical protein